MPPPPLYSKVDFDRLVESTKDFLSRPETFDISQEPSLNYALGRLATYRRYDKNEEPDLVRFCTSVLVALSKTRMNEHTKELVELYFGFLVQRLIYRNQSVALHDGTFALVSVISKNAKPLHMNIVESQLNFDDLRRFAWPDLTLRTMMIASTLGRCLA